MYKGKTIILSNGQTAHIIRGQESGYKNCYIVRLENDELRVIDQETLTLAETLGSSHNRRIHYKK